LRPPPTLTVSEWADRERRLSPEASAEPGRWDTSRAEYQRAIMDAVADPSVHTVVIMSSAQVGKTEVILNVLGFHIDQDPAPILMLQPTLDMAQAFSKDRLAPMVRDTPALHGKIKEARSRDSGNTLLHKAFPGGHVTMAGANSPSSLASRPVRIVLCDEVDRYPASAGTEGDPVTLARKRSTTFWNRKLVLTSTPTIKGQSRIEAAYGESDKRRLWVPCPHCDEHQVLRWSQVRWPEDRPDAAQYACTECGALWTDGERWQAIRRSEWRAEGESHGVAGFHLNELCSPWVMLSDMVSAFLAAKGDPDRLRAWVNTSLGETWEERGETVAAEGIDALRESYGPEALPDDVRVITAGVDTQGDRLEVEFVGWGEGEESWGVEYHVLYGDPAQPAVWEDLDALLLQSWETESGRTIRLSSAAIDSGGHHAEAVLSFCRARFRRRVYAIKGQAGQGKPVWPLRASRTRTRDNVFMVGVDTAKDAIYSRLKIEEPGPGYCHLPADPSTGYDRDWAEQVTSEQRMTRYREGRPYSVWVLPGGKRNEALDCRVYAYAALKALPKGIALPAQPRPAPQPQRQPVGIAPDGWLDRRDNWF